MIGEIGIKVHAANIAGLNTIGNSPANFSGAYHARMSRRDLLRDLIDSKFGGNQADFSRAIKRSPAQVHQWLSGHRALGDAGARNIEMALHLPMGYFDNRKSVTANIDANTEPRPPLNPRQQALLGLFDGLPASEQDRMLRELEEKKQRYDALYEELKARKQA